MRMPSASDSYTARRLRLTTGAVRSRLPEVGPSNMPARSPSTSRRSASAASRVRSASRWRLVRRAWADSSVGSSISATTCGSVGSSVRLETSRSAAAVTASTPGAGHRAPARAAHRARRRAGRAG
jgi:hypothetical protein